MLNASNKTWVNENDIVEELPFLDMKHRGNQYKFDSELWLISAMYLKLVSAIFDQFFIFSPNDSPSETMKNVFYFI